MKADYHDYIGKTNSYKIYNKVTNKSYNKDIHCE